MQLAALGGLEGFLQQHPRVKLVVLDSLAFHLRQDTQDMAARTRLLAQLAQDLMRLAERFDLAASTTHIPRNPSLCINAMKMHCTGRKMQKLAESTELKLLVGEQVVLMNHVTTRITSTQTRIVPALGTSLDKRIVLSLFRRIQVKRDSLQASGTRNPCRRREFGL